MRTLRTRFLVALFGLAVAMPAARAQQQPQDQSAQPSQPSQPVQPAQPVPALRSPLASAADNGDSQDSNQDSQSLSPDTRPLAGAQDISLGAPSGNHSYWVPHLTLSSTFDSNPLAATNQSGWTNWTSILAGVNLYRTSENNNLIIGYLGGGSIASNGGSGGIGNTTFQTLVVSEQFMWGRSTISFFDSFNFLPEAGFGYTGGTGIPIPGGGGIGLGNGFIPDQSILTPQAQSLSNSFITQVQTNLTPRSSLTFLGGYSELHYFGTDLLNSGGPMFQAGYNYQITREDTVSVFYRFNAFSYSNFNQSIHNNSAQVTYARRVTGRLAFHVGAGPSFSSFQAPISGTTGTGSGSGTVTGSTNQTFFSLNTGLTYAVDRMTLAISYNHGISEGSGVLAGSVANNIFGSASRQLTRTLSAGFNFGYSRNTGLSIATVTPSFQSFNFTYAGVNLNRSWGRSSSLSLSYQLQYQDSSVPPCVGATCGTSCTGVACATSTVRHAITLGLNWQRQPIVF